MRMTNSVITYGVFWINATNTELGWHQFDVWHESYSEALAMLAIVRNNPRCCAAKIVERIEMFDDVTDTIWNRADGNGL